MMVDQTLLKLAQDLEWLGCELEYCGHKHAMEGFPEAGPTWETFLEKQRGVMATANKIERELKNEISFNPSVYTGINYPLDESLDSIVELIKAVEVIKQAAVFAVQELPPRVRDFSRMVNLHIKADRLEPIPAG